MRTFFCPECGIVHEARPETGRMRCHMHDHPVDMVEYAISETPQEHRHCPVCQYQWNGSADDKAKPTYCPNPPATRVATRTPLASGPRTADFSRTAHGPLTDTAPGFSTPVATLL